MSNDFLYEENILEHYRNPKNKLADICTTCECVGHAQNIDCGDSGEIYLDLEAEKVISAKWSGSGCAISQAGMSMLTEKITNEKPNLEELRLWTPAIVYELLQVKISQARVKCALLSYESLVDALKKLN